MRDDVQALALGADGRPTLLDLVVAGLKTGNPMAGKSKSTDLKVGHYKKSEERPTLSRLPAVGGKGKAARG